MKRSEMIEIMRHAFLETEYLVGYEWSESMLMDYILDHIERAGMLPPKRKEVLGTMDNGDPFYYYIYEWENEE